MGNLAAEIKGLTPQQRDAELFNVVKLCASDKKNLKVNMPRIIELLAQGANPNYQYTIDFDDILGRPTLFLAAMWVPELVEPMVQSMIEHGQDVAQTFTVDAGPIHPNPNKPHESAPGTGNSTEKSVREYLETLDGDYSDTIKELKTAEIAQKSAPPAPPGVSHEGGYGNEAGPSTPSVPRETSKPTGNGLGS